MQDVDLARRAARADLCRFLAACYYEPGAEFAEEKVFDSMLDAARKLQPDIAARAQRLGAAYFAEETRNLLVDYTRLFLGPNLILAKPYGSVWLEREDGLMQGSTMAVEELYAAGGFEIDDSFREAPDHIAVELEFLYLLIYREDEACRNDDPEALRATAALRKQFLDEHLASWVGPFTAAVSAGAQSDYYRELAGLTDRFIQIEAGVDAM